MRDLSLFNLLRNQYLRVDTIFMISISLLQENVLPDSVYASKHKLRLFSGDKVRRQHNNMPLHV